MQMIELNLKKISYKTPNPINSLDRTINHPLVIKTKYWSLYYLLNVRVKYYR